jgi:hypothetical protein
MLFTFGCAIQYYGEVGGYFHYYCHCCPDSTGTTARCNIYDEDVGQGVHAITFDPANPHVCGLCDNTHQIPYSSFRMGGPCGCPTAADDCKEIITHPFCKIAAKPGNGPVGLATHFKPNPDIQSDLDINEFIAQYSNDMGNGRTVGVRCFEVKSKKDPRMVLRFGLERLTAVGGTSGEQIQRMGHHHRVKFVDADGNTKCYTMLTSRNDD